ncbi:MAG: hypothetical protein ACYTFO_07080, partial [Planctomycetota bacterium]
MFFNSLAFAIFLPIVLAGYYMLSRRWQNVWLVAAGVVFYAWLKWWFPGLLAGYILVNYACGLRIAKAGSEGKRKLYLALSVVTGLGALGFFKYCNFFIGSVSDLLTAVGLPPDWSALKIILPIGISFYTFRTLSYTIDIYRRK